MRSTRSTSEVGLVRISVVGITGSGKSTLATSLADHIGCRYIELDAIHHQADWQPKPRDQFRAELEPLLGAERWVVDGNCLSLAQDLFWGAADTVVWLDLPRKVFIPSLVRRTLVRMATRRELWNGNRESFGDLFTLDADENILLWSWTQGPILRARMEQEVSNPRWAQLEFVRLGSRSQVRSWLAAVGG